MDHELPWEKRMDAPLRLSDLIWRDLFTWCILLPREVARWMLFPFLTIGNTDVPELSMPES